MRYGPSVSPTVCWRKVGEAGPAKDAAQRPPFRPSKPAPRAPACASVTRPTSQKSRRVCASATTAARSPAHGSRATTAARRPTTRNAIGAADDTIDADGVTVFDYWQAQEQARQWGERQRLIAEGGLRKGTYTVARCGRRLSRGNHRREKAGRCARRQIRLRRLDPAGARLDPGREADHRSAQPLAQQARHPAQARPDASGPPPNRRPAKRPTTMTPAAPARPPPTAS